MKFQSLAESPLGISDDEIWSLFSPFLVQDFSPEEPEWRREINRRKKKILRKYLRQKLFGWQAGHKRDEAAIIAEYSKAWQESQYAAYTLSLPPTRISPWVWRDHRAFASDVGATRFRQLMLIKTIETVKPSKVLEVGCGNGINLLLLACRFPDIEFTGVELTEQGHIAAERFQEQTTLPQQMVDYAPLPLVDTTAFRGIRFLQGTAADLPFEDSSFDMVQTILALEQMEQIRSAALSEIARVCRGTTFMIEPFSDVNEDGWSRKNVIQRNYFQGRIADLPSYGLQPATAINDFPQEAFLKVGAVLSSKATD
jgi:ubiquinone/menaquinone biosynthesis C-methylase UbiE